MDNISHAQSRQFQVYTTLLRTWNPKINLVAPATLVELESRHITDSAQLVPHLSSAPCAVLDVGSGAGLPGLIMAILAPQHTFTLAERDQRKAAFLHTAIHELGLTNVTVFAGDVNTLAQKQPQSFQIITCRAWASLLDILRQTSPLLAPGGAWLLLKGQAVFDEIEACGTSFHFTKEMWPSTVETSTGERGWVLKLTPLSSCGGETQNEGSTGNA